MRKYSFSVLILLFISIQVFAQKAENTDEHCGMIPYLKMLNKQDPTLAKRIEAMKFSEQEYIKVHGSKLRDPKEVIRIPVVVHIVYNTPEQNIPDEQVYAQIWSLNQDFRRRNGDTINTPQMFKSVAADCGIEFCLAVRTPNDEITNGIIRTFTDKTEFGLDNTIKSSLTGGDSPWDCRHYLNIWVCDISGNYLGYAQYPGGTDSTDGVVVDYQVFGFVNVIHPHYNLGRTATHEIGHWLDLYHIWGDDFGSCDGSDYVDDTPNAKDANYYCPTHPHTTSCNNTGEMFMNYMDYVYDGCFNLYTIGQREKMLAAINLYRSDLLTSKGCNEVIGIPEQKKLSSLRIHPNPINNQFFVDGLEDLKGSVSFQIMNPLGCLVYTRTINNYPDQSFQIDLSGIQNGTYFLKITYKNTDRSFKLIKL